MLYVIYIWSVSTSELGELKKKLLNLIFTTDYYSVQNFKKELMEECECKQSQNTIMVYNCSKGTVVITNHAFHCFFQNSSKLKQAETELFHILELTGGSCRPATEEDCPVAIAVCGSECLDAENTDV